MFSFARKPGADLLLSPDEINYTVLEHTSILHTGSLALSDEPCRSAVLSVLDYAKRTRKTVSYDPNYRASLWKGEEEAVKYMRLIAGYADLIKISEEEISLITGKNDPEEAARILHDGGAACVAVTLGGRGALVSAQGQARQIPPFPVEKPTDTTGAGDSFWGAFLYRFVKSGKSPQEITVTDAAGFAAWGMRPHRSASGNGAESPRCLPWRPWKRFSAVQKPRAEIEVRCKTEPEHVGNLQISRCHAIFYQKQNT